MGLVNMRLMALEPPPPMPTTLMTGAPLMLFTAVANSLYTALLLALAVQWPRTWVYRSACRAPRPLSHPIRPPEPF